MIIDPYKTPHIKNVRFVKWLEKQTLKGYRIVLAAIQQDILDYLSPEKLKKSEDDDNEDTQLPRAWTGLVPKIELNMVDELKSVIQKRLKALDWIALGKYAGKAAEESAKDLGLTEDFVPGAVLSSYLHAIDTERAYYAKLLGEKPKDLSKKLMRTSIEELVKKAKISIDYTKSQLEYKLLETVTKIVDDHNNTSMHNVLSEGSGQGKISKEDLSEIADKAQAYIDGTIARKALKDTIKMQERVTVMSIQDQIAKGASTGAHQGLFELFGLSGEPKVIWLTIEDERVCDFCDSKSKDENGEYKIYNLSDFKPYGYNKGRKKKDWVLTIPMAHPNCRCKLLYIPPGFKLENGNIVKI